MKRLFLLYILMCSGIVGWSQKISLQLSNATLPEAFAIIEQQSDYFFMYSSGILPTVKNITVDVRDVPLTEVLDAVLKNTNLSFSVKGKMIGITRDTSLPVVSPSVKSAQFRLTGKIVDASTQQPIPAVNILIKGTSAGTTSGKDGNFSMTAMETDVLIFSFIGYKSQEMLVGTRSIIEVALQEDMSKLEEVKISGGYYSTTELKKTGSIEKVTARDIEHQPVTSPLMALQGRMPGVEVTPNSGVAGSATRVVIRGRNSISNRITTPLYIIDGIPVNSTRIDTDNDTVVPEGFDPLSMINPANIESIEVLKDADATAIYGSQGADGVILITTKRGGQSEKTNVDISFYSGVGKIPHFLEMATTPQYVAIRKEALKNSGKPIDVTNASDLVLWDTTRHTNWQKELLGGTANITDLQANLSSGNASTSFRFGAAYHRESTIYPGDFGYQRATGNISITHTSTNKKLHASVNMNYGLEVNKLFSGFSLVNEAIYLAPNAPDLYDTDGNLNWQGSTFNNPLAALKRMATNTGTNIILNTVLGYDFFPGLSAKVNLGYNALDLNSIAKNPLSSIDPARITGTTTASSTFGHNQRNGWIVEPQITYHKNYNELELNAVAGATLKDNKATYQSVVATGYTSDAQLESLKGATTTRYASDNDSQYRYMAFFGRIGLEYRNKYILNLTGRHDGSSRFGPDHRWGNFGAAGAAWIFSEEKWMQRFSFLSLGKVRASYGVTGSDQVGDYEYLSRYEYTNNTYLGQIGLTPTGLANNSYAWEQTIKLETALQLGFLNDRLMLEAAFYRNRCSSQLLNYALPSITGFTGVTQNLNATVQNSGLEIALHTININLNVFQWRSSLNFTLPRNKLISYPNIEQSPYGGASAAIGSTSYVVGKSLNIVRVYDYIGVNPTTGLSQVVDVDGNGIFDYRDKTAIQNTGRQYYGGVNNTLRYKNMELSFLLQISQQISSNSVFYIPGLRANNIPAVVVENYWQKEGDIAKYQKATTISSDSGTGLANQSNAAYTSSSFIRLKTLSLSYSLSSSLLEKIKLKGIKIFLQGQNLITFSNFNALDPEAKTDSLPPMLMLTAGVDIKL